ncbi:MAG: hypothetical protein ACYDAC_06940 [Candidatus Dormibacteria bacterium]
MKQFTTMPHKGVIAALVATPLLLGGGLVGALQVGSSPDVSVPPVLVVRGSTVASGTASSSSPPAPSPSTPAVVGPDRSVITFGAQPPRNEPAEGSGSPRDG